MTRSKQRDSFDALALGLSAVAARLEPREAHRVFAEAAAPLARTMTDTKDPLRSRDFGADSAGGGGSTWNPERLLLRHAHTGPE